MPLASCFSRVSSTTRTLLTNASWPRSASPCRRCCARANSPRHSGTPRPTTERRFATETTFASSSCSPSWRTPKSRSDFAWCGATGRFAPSCRPCTRSSRPRIFSAARSRAASLWRSNRSFCFERGELGPEAPAVDLAGSQERQRAQQVVALGAGEGRESGLGELLQSLESARSVGALVEYDGGDHLVPPESARSTDHDELSHAWRAAQYRLDGTRGHVFAAADDQIIGSSEHGERTARTLPAKVTGDEQPALERSLFSQVASHQHGAADAQATVSADGEVHPNERRTDARAGRRRSDRARALRRHLGAHFRQSIAVEDRGAPLCGQRSQVLGGLGASH